MRLGFAAIGFALVLSGCGEESLTCGASNVTGTVIDLARKKIAQEGRSTLDPKVLMLAEGPYSVEAIRTQTSSDTKVSCSAELHTSMKGNALMTLDAMRKEGFNTDPVFLITYEAQRTDDSKSTYVTLHGID